jgi:hypothetical protein
MLPAAAASAAPAEATSKATPPSSPTESEAAPTGGPAGSGAETGATSPPATAPPATSPPVASPPVTAPAPAAGGPAPAADAQAPAAGGSAPAADGQAPTADAPSHAAESREQPAAPAAAEESEERPARRRLVLRKPLLDDDLESSLTTAVPEKPAPEKPVEPPVPIAEAEPEPDEVQRAVEASDTTNVSADDEAAGPAAADEAPESGVAAAAATKANRDAVSLSAASSAAFAAAAAWAAAGESGNKPLGEPPPGASHASTSSPLPSEAPAVATGQAPAGEPRMSAGQSSGGATSAMPSGTAPESPIAGAPAPPPAPGSPGWQAAARPVESLSTAPVEQPTGGLARPAGTSPASSAPWLAEPETPVWPGSPARQAPAAGDVGRQPLIVPASSDPPWVERPDETATVAWTPKPGTQGPTDTPWVEPEIYRSEIEVVKPPDELGGPAPSGVICSACGTENDTTRRFCRSCGNPLFTVETALPEVEEPKPRSWRWLAILLPVLLVAGVLGFVGAALIRGGLFATASPSPGPIAPGSGIVLQPSGATASSTLGGLWPPRDAIDKDTTSSWREASGRLAGEWIQVTFKQPVTILSITIWAGAQKDQENYKGNLRPRHITIAADGGRGQAFELTDTFGSQAIAYSGPVNSTLKITIQDAYLSERTTFPRSPTQDCVISEIQFNGTQP